MVMLIMHRNDIYPVTFVSPQNLQNLHIRLHKSLLNVYEMFVHCNKIPAASGRCVDFHQFGKSVEYKNPFWMYSNLVSYICVNCVSEHFIFFILFITQYMFNVT